MAISSDGNQMALACIHPGTIQIWDMLTVTKVQESKFYFPHELVFFPNSRDILFAAGLSIQTMDVSTGDSEFVESFSGDWIIKSLAVSPDCKHVAWAGPCGIRVQEYEDTSRRANEIDETYIKATFSPLNTYLVLESFKDNRSRKSLQILNTKTITEVTAQAQLENFIIGISPNDEYIAYVATHGLCLWSEKGGELVLDTSDLKFTSLAFSFPGDRLISGDGSGTFMIWNTHTCQLVGPPYNVMPSASEARIIALAFSCRKNPNRLIKPYQPSSRR